MGWLPRPSIKSLSKLCLKNRNLCQRVTSHQIQTLKEKKKTAICKGNVFSLPSDRQDLKLAIHSVHLQYLLELYPIFIQGLLKMYVQKCTYQNFYNNKMKTSTSIIRVWLKYWHNSTMECNAASKSNLWWLFKKKKRENKMFIHKHRMRSGRTIFISNY